MVKTKDLVEKTDKKITKDSWKAKIDTKEVKDVDFKPFSWHYFYWTWKRKTSVAKVRLYDKWTWKIVVNWRNVMDYFTPVLKDLMLSPLKMLWYEWRFNISIKTEWWWISSQADASRHWIAKAILEFDLESRSTLKKEWHITRDSRVKERKKPGLKRARKAPTWVKR